MKDAKTKASQKGPMCKFAKLTREKFKYVVGEKH